MEGNANIDPEILVSTGRSVVNTTTELVKPPGEQPVPPLDNWYELYDGTQTQRNELAAVEVPDALYGLLSEVRQNLLIRLYMCMCGIIMCHVFRC